MFRIFIDRLCTKGERLFLSHHKEQMDSWHIQGPCTEEHLVLRLLSHHKEEKKSLVTLSLRSVLASRNHTQKGFLYYVIRLLFLMERVAYLFKMVTRTISIQKLNNYSFVRFQMLLGESKTCLSMQTHYEVKFHVLIVKVFKASVYKLWSISMLKNYVQLSVSQ